VTKLRPARIRNRLLVSGTLISLIACGPKLSPAAAPPAAAETVPAWWSPQLALADLGAISAELDKPFDEPLEMVKSGAPQPEPMAGCRDYLRLRPQGYEPTDPTAWGWMHELGARCQSLIVLQRVKPSRDDGLSSLLASADLLARLPAALAVAQSPDELKRRTSAARAGQTLNAYDPAAKIKEQSATNAVIESADMTTKLDLIARGDFNGDGAQDALIRSFSHGSEGSWFDQRLVLIGPGGAEAQLTLREEPPL
jgi:hypothetical protein